MPQASKSQKIWKRPTDDAKSVIFLHSGLDDYGLDVYEFRVMAHVARRESKKQGKGCFARQKTIAETCNMSHRKAQGVLRILCEAGLLEKEHQKGSTNVYRVAPPSQWKEPSELQTIRNKAKSDEDNFTLVQGIDLLGVQASLEETLS